jgi:hypothetical protein
LPDRSHRFLGQKTACRGIVSRDETSLVRINFSGGVRPAPGILRLVRAQCRPVALGRAPLLVLHTIIAGIPRGLLGGLKRNAFKVGAMDTLGIKVLGFGGEAFVFGLKWHLVGQPFALFARAGAHKPQAHQHPDNRKGSHCLAPFDRVTLPSLLHAWGGELSRDQASGRRERLADPPALPLWPNARRPTA